MTKDWPKFTICWVSYPNGTSLACKDMYNFVPLRSSVGPVIHSILPIIPQFLNFLRSAGEPDHFLIFPHIFPNSLLSRHGCEPDHFPIFPIFPIILKFSHFLGWEVSQIISPYFPIIPRFPHFLVAGGVWHIWSPTKSVYMTQYDIQGVTT